MAAHIKTYLEQILAEKDLSQENLILTKKPLDRALVGNQPSFVDYEMLVNCSTWSELLDVASAILPTYEREWMLLGEPKDLETWLARENGEDKPNAYHFSFGNSTDGPVGYCATVNAWTPAMAVDKLKMQIDAIGDFDFKDYEGERDESILDWIEGEYMEIYFNSDAIGTKDIDFWTDPVGNEHHPEEPNQGEVENWPMFQEEV